MTAWCNRPLDAVYPVIFIDAIVVKVRDGQVRNKPIYVVIGVTVNGERDILGLWAGDGGEGAKFWLQVLTELKNRGVARRVHRGLRRPERPPRRDHHRLGAHHGAALHHPPDPQHVPVRVAEVLGPDRPDLRPVYTAATEAAAKARFAEFTSRRSPTAIESLNAHYRVQGPGCQVEALHRCLVVGEVRSSCRSWITTSRSARSCPDRRILMSRSDV